MWCIIEAELWEEGILMIKRVLSFALVIITALSLPLSFASAAGKMKIAPKGVSAPASPGTEVKVPVYFTNNPGYGFGYVEMKWDKTKLEFMDIKYSKLAPAQSSAAPIYKDGWYKISFGDQLARENYKGDGVAFTLIFKVADSASAGDTKVEIYAPELYDWELNEISADTAASVVKLTGNSSGKSPASSNKSNNYKTDDKSRASSADKSSKSGGSGASGLKNEDKKAEKTKIILAAETVGVEKKSGAQVKLPVRFSENTGYAFGTVTAKWDNSALTLTDIEYSKLAPKQAYSNPVKNNGSFIIMFGNEAAVQNFTGKGTAFTLVFKVNDSAEARKYDISLEKTEAYTYDLKEVDAQAVKGSVNIVDGSHKHTLEKIAKAEPTCEADGTEEYYICTACGMKFSDNDGKHAVDSPKTVPALGHSLKYDEEKKLYVCERCGKTFEDKEGKTEIGGTISSTSDSAQGGFPFVPVIIGGGIVLAAGAAAGIVIYRRNKLKSGEKQ